MTGRIADRLFRVEPPKYTQNNWMDEANRLDERFGIMGYWCRGMQSGERTEKEGQIPDRYGIHPNAGLRNLASVGGGKKRNVKGFQAVYNKQTGYKAAGL